MSMGSASELEYFLLRARDQEYLSREEYEVVAHEVVEMRRMLSRLLSKVQAERGVRSTEQLQPSQVSG